MHCRPNMVGPIVHPTQCCYTHTHGKTFVPHIHPQHTTNINHQHFAHVHYYPQTQSNVSQATHQHFVSPGPGPYTGSGFGGY